MISRTITYRDFNDVERSETFYFGLSKSELTRINLSYEGGFSEALQRYVETKNYPELYDTLVKMISMSYGVKSPDGKYFTKNADDTEKFLSSNAFEELFVELLQNSDLLNNFIMGILPGDVAKQVAENTANNAVPTLAATTE